MASLYRNVFGMTTAVSAALILASTAGAMIDNPEIEPNETRAQATIAASGGAGMAVGDTISGTTTGTSTTVAGAASADIFRVKTSARPLAIYRHRLTLTSSTLFQTGTIRGLTTTANSTTGGAVTTTDSTAQTAPTALTGGVPARAVQWYGFGKQEEIYYRVAGTTSTTGSYTATLSSDVVAPIDLGSVLTGNVTVARASSSTQDMDWWVYNSNFDAISNFGHDDPEPGSVTQLLAPGVYYIAAGNFNTANNQPPAIGDTFAGTVLDFPNAAMNNSTTLATNAAMTVSSSVGGGPLNGTATRTEAFQIVWYKFTVDPVTVPTNPGGTATATPATVNNSGTASTQFVVNVIPGLNPTSTGITVNADLTNLGGSATNAMFDDGAHGDGAAGDNVFGLSYTVPNTVTTGAKVVNFGIADAQTRAGTASTTVTVVPPPPVNDECANATVISGTGNFNYVTTTATTSTPAITCTTSGADIWYSWTAPSDGSFRFATCGTAPSYDSTVAVYSTCPVDSSTQLGCNDDFCGLLSQLDLVMTAGQNVRIRVGGFGTVPATTAAGVLTITGLTPTNPTGTGTATPNQAVNDVSTPVTFVVDTTGGQFPNSTGLGVTLDTTLIGGGVITLLDDGNAPDVTAGDGNFSGSGTVAMGTTPGALALPFTVTDAEMRSGSGTIAISVREPSGACCVTGSCSITTLSACNSAGGTFLGDGAACAQEGTYDINGSTTALEDISATGTVISATPGDDATFAVPLSFPFPFYGVPQNTCNVSTNGNIQFPPSNVTTFTNTDLPTTGTPNGALYVCWDDFNFNVNTNDGLFTETRGTPGVDLRQIIQWNNVAEFGSVADTNFNTFQAVLFEDGTVEYRYGTMSATVFTANDSTIGIENAAGTSATQLDETLVGSNTAVSFIYSGAQSNCPSGCRADFNNDGTLDPDDLADYIGAFFTEPAPLTADFNGDGTVDPDDLADYIGAFFAGCP